MWQLSYSSPLFLPLFIFYEIKRTGGSLRMRNENRFQSALIREIQGTLKECYILKNDGSNVPQGFPDLLILYRDKWGALECKREAGAGKQNNQEYYVDRLNGMSFSKFISPENKEEVLNELYSTFGFSR